jgi:hypothetical protein
VTGTLIRRAGILAATLIVGVAAIEGLSSAWLMVQQIRAIQPHQNFRQAAYDSLLGWKGLANLSIRDNYGPNIHLTTNDEGMRIHRPITPALAPNQRRAICSGDSFAFGSGVSDDETLCAYLEGEIPHLETVNMAQRGYGIDQAYLWYRRDAARWPHQLHLFMFIWADFERMAVTSFTGYPKPIMELHDGALVTKNVPVPPWSGSTRGYEIAGILSGARLLELVQRRVNQSDSAKLARVDAQVWNVAEGVFSDLARLNADRHSALVLVYLPTLADYTPGAYDTRRARLTAFSKRTGIPFVDLTSDLRTVSRDSVDWLFITANQLPVQGSAGHYTARGNAWAAAQLAKHLRTVPAAASALPQ